jgi:hypothetical protein
VLITYHAAHGVDAATVARADEEVRVGAHEALRHADEGAVGEQAVGVGAERLDVAEDVVPAAAVEPRRVVAQLVQDLVHLERRRQRLHQHGRPDAATLDARRLLRPLEHAVPYPRLPATHAYVLQKFVPSLSIAYSLMCACSRHVPGVLHLGEVEEGPEPGALPGAEGVVAVEEVERKVHEAAEGRLAVDNHVRLGEVPAARPHEQLGGLGVEPVRPAARRVVEGDRAGHGVPQVHLPAHQVLPRRRQRVLKVSLPRHVPLVSSEPRKLRRHSLLRICTRASSYHEDLGPGVERVDDHLPRLGWPRDLHGPVRDDRRHGRARPAALTDEPRGRVEPRQLAGVVTLLGLPPALHGVPDGAAELAVQAGHEGQRVAGEDGGELGVVPPTDVHALRRVVGGRRRGCRGGGH